MTTKRFGTLMSTAGLTALLAGSLAAGTAQAAATDTAPAGAETSSLACEDPFEASSVDLVVGQPLTRGLCEPDGRYGGGDKDFLGFAAQAGKSYRIALIERGPGWDGAQLHIEDFYAIGSQVTFEKPDAYSAVTKPMPAGVASALFSVEALSTSDYFRTLSGPGFGYTILVTEVEESPATSVPTPTTQPSETAVPSEPVASKGSKRKR